VLRHIPGTREPLPGAHPWHALIELADTAGGEGLRADFERAVGLAVEDGLVRDAVIAESTAQSQALWKLRETIPEASRDEGLVYRHDISLPVSRIPEFIEAAGAALEKAFPGVRLFPFGHLGDGNLHYNCFVPGRDRDDAAARDSGDVNRVVLDIVRSFNGSFSAEHGIGQAKRKDLAHYKSAMELETMRTLKLALDPRGIMNPGKLLPD